MVRIMAGAFIINGKDYLMMKRSENKKIAPGMWGGVGGHAEPNELNDPRETCIREVYEETGIAEKDLEKLNLKYCILRREKEEITLIYMFIGGVRERFYEDRTEEGKLYWINEKELLDRPMSFEIRNVLEHYITVGHKDNEIKVGVVSVTDNKPQMNWNSLDSWEGLTGMR